MNPDTIPILMAWAHYVGMMDADLAPSDLSPAEVWEKHITCRMQDIWRARASLGVPENHSKQIVGVVRPNPQCGDTFVVIDGMHARSSRDLFGGLEGQRVRVTVEVLP